MADPRQVLTDFTLARTSLIMGAYALAKNLRQRQALVLVREPNSKVDPNDVMVVLPGLTNRKIGYLPPGLAAKIAPLMDAGVKVIAQKAPNVLYGICQLAYLPPNELKSEVTEVQVGVSDPATGTNIPASITVKHTLPEPRDVEIVSVDNSNVPPAPFDVPAAPLTVPEGVTQEDIDSATDLPPLGDSRRPHQKEPTDAEPTPDDDADPQEGL